MSVFTQALRVRGEAGLVPLLAVRPDLAAPPPSSVRSLAARAANRVSLDRALAALDAATLQALEAVLALDGTTAPATDASRATRPGAPAPRTGVTLAQLAAAIGAPVPELRPAVVTALTAALLWTDPPLPDDAWVDLPADVALRPAPGLADVLGPHPAGLGPTLRASLERRSPAALARLADALGVDGSTLADATPDDPAPETLLAAVVARLAAPAVVDGLLAEAPAAVRPVLDALAWGPPVGRSPDAAPGGPSPARAGVEWALRHGLLAVSDAQHVVLPCEIGLALRGGRTHRSAEVPPEVTGPVVGAGTVAAESAREAEEVVRLVAGLVTLWGEDPAPVLRAGGIGARELRRAAQRLEVAEDAAALVVEVAGAAGLVVEDGEDSAAMAPAAAADDWLALPSTERWADLAVAWLRSERAAWLVGTRTEKGALRPALDPESRRPWAPRLRRAVLDVLAGLPEGTAAAAAAVHDVLRWRTPRSVPPLHAVEAVLTEAAALGILGAGALSPAGRALLADDDGAPVPTDGLSGPAAALAGQLPPDVDEVLLQGDLTGIVPGRPTPGLGGLLEGAAQVESRGAALTVRFTETSVRRALDSGRTAEDLLADLSRHARSGVPQPLEYLVLDTARRHGRTRVGLASSYVRADDPTLLAGLAEDPALRGLGLLRLAPTVLAAQATPAALLAALRDRGLAPVTEDATGHVVLGATTAHRVRPARGRRTAPAGAPVGAPEATAARDRRLHRVARDLLAVDRRERAAASDGGGARDAGTADDGAPGTAASDPVLGLDLLREAAGAGRDVWLEMVDPAGVPVRRRVRPVRVDGGRVRVVDAERETEMTVAVHRIASVTPV
ncbi:helicase-associated domain-containing protein [Actinotalea sp. Marseille-Q4924]|uniref:helicase-associated domain-containing protein n=1 Tax=Actinotalea sp. Marseille-Q4924 TaxID=2866571 RepID=UPI001CE46DEB|nr:helicase-associated domain-containing protein [Actinotalea sp. Marseille-Q4924]